VDDYRSDWRHFTLAGLLKLFSGIWIQRRAATQILLVSAVSTLPGCPTQSLQSETLPANTTYRGSGSAARETGQAALLPDLILRSGISLIRRHALHLSRAIQSHRTAV
jgi:hypothetical protein